MTARIKIKELTGLKPQYAAFAIEYFKDYDVGLAAERAGFARSYGPDLFNMPDVQKAMAMVTAGRMEAASIDAEWILMELVDNHILARQTGKITASNTALRTLAQLAAIDAFAAEKVHIAGDSEIRERLLRGRKRGGIDSEVEDVEEPAGKAPSDLSFF